MTDIISNFLLDIIGEAGDFLNFAVSKFSLVVFYIEDFILEQSGTIGLNIGKMWKVLYGAGISMLTVKCLIKGFEQYILWSDGDPDNPPIEMVIRAVKAIAVAACFPTLYKWFVDIVLWLINQLISAITVIPPLGSSIKDIIGNFSIIGTQSLILGPLLVIIYIILLVILIMQFIKKGVEMLILRLGVPLGVIGFLDSDGGLSKNYFKVFYQCSFSVIIQLVLFKFSIGLWAGCSNSITAPITALIAIAVMLVAISAPKFVSQFLVQTGGGGSMVSNMYFASSMASQAKRLFVK